MQRRMSLYSAPTQEYDRLEPLRLQLLLLVHDLPAVPLPQPRDALPTCGGILALAPRMGVAVVAASRRQRRRGVQPQVAVAVLHAGRGDELALVAVVHEVVLEQVVARRRLRARVHEAVAPLLLLLLVMLPRARPRRVVRRPLLPHRGRRLRRPPPHPMRVADSVMALHAPEPEVVGRPQEALLVALCEAETAAAAELLLSVSGVKPAAEPRRKQVVLGLGGVQFLLGELGDVDGRSGHGGPRHPLSLPAPARGGIGAVDRPAAVVPRLPLPRGNDLLRPHHGRAAFGAVGGVALFHDVLSPTAVVSGMASLLH